MKKISTTTVLSLFLLAALAQVNKNIKPVSESVREEFLSPLKEIILPEFNITEADRLDKIDAKNGELPKFSRSIFTNINLDNSGSWTELPGGDRLWRVKVTSSGAEALLPYFNKFYLPPGSVLHVYSPDKKEMIGAFTSANNPVDGYYATGLIHGESCVLEYYEPREAKGKAVISLNEIGHAYRWVNHYFPKRSRWRNDTLGFQQSDNCEVNINCSEGAAWQNQKRAVACVIVQGLFGQGICSGTMVNTVRQDCTPYLLSAQHCSEGTSTSQYSQWLFYFNFESPNCSNPSVIGTLGDYFIGGCTKKADSNDNGGDTGSDFLLLHLNNAPPDSFNIYYAGWNRVNTPSDSGVGIHHPNGDIKKISTYTTILQDTSWGGTRSGTHWQVHWRATTHGHGVTEPGSSGSSLFNKQGQIIGTLTGGDSFCNDPNAPDQYGKVFFDWDSNGTAVNRRLSPWLDPDNTGVFSINGRNADCSTTGMAELHPEVIEFSVVPNPSSGVFNIGFLSEEIHVVRVFDAVGRMLLERKYTDRNCNLDLSFETKGIYFLQVEGKNGGAMKKVILN